MTYALIQATTWDDYRWLVIMGGFISFGMAWCIGANDVANSFATSIGARTITMFQACLIATVLEFLGAMSLGGEVSKTIAGSIAKPATFASDPELFAYGMMCALFSASTWVFIATYFGLAVSTTHSIIGSVMGFTLVWKGTDAVIWSEPINEFPYVKGVVPIVVSWVTSPIMSSLLAMTLFFVNRMLVLRRQNSTFLAYYALPPLVFTTVFINLFFILYKGAKAELAWAPNQAAWVSAVTAGGCSALSAIVGVPLLKRLVANTPPATPPIFTPPITDVETSKDTVQPHPTHAPDPPKLSSIYSLITRGLNQDIFEVPEYVQEMHDAAEVFAPETEQVYKYLQVFSSCCVAFAHGANDVANAIGPYAAIYYVYNNFKVSSSAPTPKWMLALGGAGIVIGLWTYGYNVIRSLGGQLCKLTPSRGYCAELATALTVSFASVYGIPISTTHCIVGAEVGIGVMENLKTGVNWKLFAKTFMAWVFTLIITGLISAAVFAQGIYAPSIHMSRDINIYETGLRSIIQSANASVVKDASFQSIFNPKVSGYIPPQLLLTYTNNTC